VKEPALQPRPHATVTLLVLTLNEIDGMKAIMPRLDPSWYDQLLVVDGGSTDGTIEWAREQGYEVHVQQRRGIRYAYFEVLDKIRGELVVTFSPDGNSDPACFPALVAKLREGWDMVIVSRYLPPAKSQDDDLFTAFGNWLFTRTINLLHGGRYTDAMVIYRGFRESLIAELDLDREESYRLPERIFHTIISWEPLLSVRAAKRKLAVSEIPGDEPPRIGGERKLRVLQWGGAYYFQFWWELFHWR
jgi:glycosyltransferase involved in cell wall biosynthesis